MDRTIFTFQFISACISFFLKTNYSQFVWMKKNAIPFEMHAMRKETFIFHSYEHFWIFRRQKRDRFELFSIFKKNKYLENEFKILKKRVYKLKWMSLLLVYYSNIWKQNCWFNETMTYIQFYGIIQIKNVDFVLFFKKKWTKDNEEHVQSIS